MEKLSNKPIKEEVLKEFPLLGEYRIRFIRSPKRPSEAPGLDIREYISSETFERFTRRGIRLGERAQMDLLEDVLKEILEAGGFAKPAPGLLPVQ